MKDSDYLIKIIFAFTLLCAIFPCNAYAYLDPGTGSYILQLIIAGLLGASFTIKLFWKNIRAYCSNLFKGSKRENDSE